VRSPFCALVLALLAACSSSDDREATAASAASFGPDAIVLRVPAIGGAARAYRYPALDSLIWSTKAALPAQIHPLAFSIDDGTLAVTDAAGVPWRLTLGSGQLERAMATPLTNAVSVDGSGIFGATTGTVIRLTASDGTTPWQVRSTAGASQLQPLRDGGVMVIEHRGATTMLTRYRPPATAAVDSAEFDGAATLISAAGGDRIYLSDGPRRLTSVRSRDLEKLGSISIGDSIVSTASSPSGDRVYVLGRDNDQTHVQVINKYADQIVAKFDVPAGASALRMDPLGRYLLVRLSGAADSVLVLGIASDKVLGRFASPWRADLPLVFPDGRLGTLRGDDVVILAADTFRPMDVIAGGAADLWGVVQWNGFRRRPGDAPLRATAARADSAPRKALAADSAKPPVTAALRDTTAPARKPTADSAVLRTAKVDSSSIRTRLDSLRKAALRTDSARRLARADSVRRAVNRADSVRRAKPAAADPNATLGARGSFVVQFAALKAEGPAQQLASSIRANGERARVVMTSTNGTSLYRVILGPFPSRADAERAGQAARRDYWVFEGGSN
jgi:SPOR domain